MKERTYRIIGWIALIPLAVAIIIVEAQKFPCFAASEDAGEEIVGLVPETPEKADFEGGAMPCEDPEAFRRWLSEQETGEEARLDDVREDHEVVDLALLHDAAPHCLRHVRRNHEEDQAGEENPYSGPPDGPLGRKRLGGNHRGYGVRRIVHSVHITERKGDKGGYDNDNYHRQLILTRMLLTRSETTLAESQVSSRACMIFFFLMSSTVSFSSLKRWLIKEE